MFEVCLGFVVLYGAVFLTLKFYFKKVKSEESEGLRIGQKVVLSVSFKTMKEERVDWYAFAIRKFFRKNRYAVIDRILYRGGFTREHRAFFRDVKKPYSDIDLYGIPLEYLKPYKPIWQRLNFMKLIKIEVTDLPKPIFRKAEFLKTPKKVCLQ